MGTKLKQIDIYVDCVEIKTMTLGKYVATWRYLDTCH